jgi:hypothetical protein
MSASSPLAIKIATPCSASWDRMTGDDRVRFCGECRLHVYNLSSLTRAEAEELLRQKEGRVCVRFYERADGTVMTQKCPGALAATRRVVMRVAALAAGFVVLVLGLAGLLVPQPRPSGQNRFPLLETEPVKTVVDCLSPAPSARCVMGAPLPPPPTVVTGNIEEDEDLP